MGAGANNLVYPLTNFHVKEICQSWVSWGKWNEKRVYNFEKNQFNRNRREAEVREWESEWKRDSVCEREIDFQSNSWINRLVLTERFKITKKCLYSSSSSSSSSWAFRRRMTPNIEEYLSLNHPFNATAIITNVFIMFTKQFSLIPMKRNKKLLAENQLNWLLNYFSFSATFRRAS